MFSEKPTWFTYPDNYRQGIERPNQGTISHISASGDRLAGAGEIAPPRSLGRYAPGVRLRRALRTHTKLPTDSVDKQGTNV